MTETKRAFAPGDSVISVTCVVAPPVEAHGVRLEIPLACRGTVVEVRHADHPQPYAVVFEVPEAGGAPVEVDVTEDQIVRVTPSQVTALKNLEELARTNVSELRRKLHEPSKQYPHHSCRFWHVLHKVQMFGLWALAVAVYPLWNTVWTLAVLVFLYGHQLWTHRTWAWVPDVLAPDVPDETQRLDVSEGLVEACLVADVTFAVCLLLATGSYLVNTSYVGHTNAIVSVLLTVMTLASGLLSMTIHERAVRIVPDN